MTHSTKDMFQLPQDTCACVLMMPQEGRKEKVVFVPASPNEFLYATCVGLLVLAGETLVAFLGWVKMAAFGFVGRVSVLSVFHWFVSRFRSDRPEEEDRLQHSDSGICLLLHEKFGTGAHFLACSRIVGP